MIGSYQLTVLSVSNLHKAYGNLKAVDGISFDIAEGEIFGLLGPNGAGKSTTINIIATLIAADSGDVTLNGTITPASREYKRRLGYVPQEISLTEKMTARENLCLFGRLYDLGGETLKHRVAEIIEAVGLADRADDFVHTFSGGMKRRLNIAASLLHEPDLLLMDEPTAGVDPQARAYIFEIVERLAGQGRAILYTTHYMEEAQRLCKRTAIIDHGRVLATGTLAELIQGINAKRDLVVEAKGDGLTAAIVGRLATKIGDVPWTLDETTLAAHLNIADAECSLLDAVKAAGEMGLELSSIGIREPNLETVFLELTGRALRD